MKKKIVSMISLLACLALVTGCGEEESSVPASIDGGNNYGDISQNTSDGGNSTSQIISDAAIDKDIAAFLDGINVTIPSLANYNLEYKVIYYLAYEEYIFTATGTGLGADVEHQYAALFTADTGLTSLNNEDYPVEDYGYLFNDSLQSILVNFFTENGTFNFTIERYDGNAGTLDVSNVDKSWYVDYLNFYGLELFDGFPSSSILSELVIEEELVIPSITADKYVGGFEPSYVDDYGRTVPDTFYIVLQGDQMLDYGVILEGAGYTVEINETTEEVLDLETFDYVEVTSTTITAYDANKVIYIDISLDESENTIVAFNYFGDVFTSNKTTNTDWTDEEKALMNETLHQLLPFMAFGEDYVIYDASDDDWTLFVIQDSYFEDLSEDYINILLGLGFKVDDTTYEDTYYVLDNGYVYIEIYVGYDGGNYLEVYYEASKLEPLTSFSLDTTSLDIVAGASYQLKAIYNPTSAVHPTTWSSSNEDVATVDNKGLVTVNSAATVDSTAVITATTVSGKTASCTVTVKANEVTGIAFKEDNYNVAPGAEAYYAEYYFLPYGATATTNVSYSINPDNAGITYSADGKLSANESAVVGTTATITVTCGSFFDTATVTVIPATITHTLNGGFFGIPVKESSYSTYKKTVDGANYEAQASAGNDADSGKGLQLRSKNSNSGVIANFAGRTCKSITFTFDNHTQAGRSIEIYASNSPFTIADMYKNSVTKVGTIDYSSSNLTQTYTFTADYSYIGFRSADGALYLKSVDVVW